MAPGGGSIEHGSYRRAEEQQADEKSGYQTMAGKCRSSHCLLSPEIGSEAVSNEYSAGKSSEIHSWASIGCTTLNLSLAPCAGIRIVRRPTLECGVAAIAAR